MGTGTICIFTTNESGGAGTRIEFDGDGDTPDARSHISNYKVIMSLVTQENPNPNTNNPNSLQDTGLAIVEYELTGYFDEKDGTASGIAYCRNWLREAKTSASLPFGIFGIRNDVKPEFDLTPSADEGLILEHFECNEDYEFLGRVPFVIKLRYNGDITALGA